MPTRAAEQFLDDYVGRTLPWVKPADAPTAFEADRVLFGNGDNALEVAVASATWPGVPRSEDLRALFRKRHANRPSPVLLVVLYADPGQEVLAAVTGTTGDPVPATGLSVDRVARVCAAALAEPDRHAAARAAERLLAGLREQSSAGLVNSGLFASHELRTGVPARPDWRAAREAAIPLLGLRGSALVRSMGYETAPSGSAALLISHNGRSRAVAVLLDETEVFDRPAPRFGAISPIAHGLAIAAREEIPWLVVLRGTQIRLYPARPGVGVGRKGQAETYTELDLALLAEENAAYLTLLFAPSALGPGGTAEQILAASENFAVGLGERLRERIYVDVVRRLALAVADRMRPQTDAELAEAYHRSLVILFRLLFLAYAEDRELLPYGLNPRYDRHAIKTLARDFAADSGIVFDQHATSMWDDMLTVWAAVDEGNSSWDVPAYNGGLFSRDPAISPAGAALAEMHLTDGEFGPALRALLVDLGEEGTQGPVDFRSLGVREFGTIYEGLLESDLSISQANLAVDASGYYLPARPGDAIIVPEGHVYIHNKSGERKATGSYFTKQFAVEHLLDTTLEPAVDAHLARVYGLLEKEDEAAAAEAFFDFRVADLAMGSGHFLVAAIDRIEARFTAFLTEHPIPAVSAELARLAQAAREALGERAVDVEIETGVLLRRQIARRCVFGLDLNLMAVELARLGIWIHTFVPGLPMSALDHNLVVGNSLTGIGTIDEVLDILEPQRQPGQVSFYADEIYAALQNARARLTRAARTAEATKAEVREAARAHAKAMQDAADAKALLDAAVGTRLGVIPLPNGPEDAITAGNSDIVQALLAELRAAHMPYLFPEVFLRSNPGFDVLIGNPPWEKVKVEEHQWWGLRFPGLRSLPQKDKNAAIARYRRERPDLLAEYEHDVTVTDTIKEVLGKGPFPGLRAATDTDLSLAFAWRFWHLLRVDGRAGIVLPRGIHSGRAAAQWRTTIISSGEFSDVTFLVNARYWVFDMEARYTIGLTAFVRGQEHCGEVTLQGPYFSHDEYRHGISRPPYQLPSQDFATWTDGAAFPLLPRADSLRVFLKLRSHPRLDAPDGDWQFVPLRELHTTDNKAMFDFDLARPTGDIPVLTGASFNLWNPEYGEPYAYAKASEIVPWLQARRHRQIRLASSAFCGLSADWAADPATLPCLRPRIAFRDVCRATDSRTMICALLPGNIALVEKAPYLMRRRGTLADEAYLLGILSSLPFDWYTRRFVELKMSYGLLNSFPVPRPGMHDARRHRVSEVAARLAAVDGRYAAWASGVGVRVGSVQDDPTRDDLIAELDAVVGLLYGLDRSDVKHIFETFHRGWDYQPRLTAVLWHYDRWATFESAVESA